MNSLSDTRTDLPFDSVSGRVAPVGLSSKRFIDIVLASFGIILLAPLLLMCVVLTWASSGGPVIFRHRRVGFGGKQFDCLKFRTMVADAPERLRQHLESDSEAAAEWEATQKLHNDPRVTAVGALLRKSSLDELPQLVNVLKGEMSIVGPRPVTEDELTKYGAFVGAYAACRPGITGLWQVSGRSSMSYEQRVECDTFYARRWSLYLDVKILIVTIPAVLFSEGAC